MNLSSARRTGCAIALTAILLAAGAARAGVTPARAPRIPAFPGAEGFGAYTPGGRGGRIIEVTNLNSAGPGSLRAACQAKGPRIVVFRVSGLINGPIAVTQPFITIAGQTAPGDGICIKRGGVSIVTNDVVVRYLRSRPGDYPFGVSPEDRDCIGLSGARARNVIVDHCSASWGIDENVQTWGGPRNVTFQWLITSESLMDSLHPKGPHGMGMIVGSDSNTVSVHHCLFAHNNGRNPYTNMKKSKTRSIVDLRNNVVYGFERCLYATGGGNVSFNYVGNLILAGAAARPSRVAFWVMTYGRPTKVYVEDNIWPAMPRDGSARWRAAHLNKGSARQLPKALRLAKPVAAPRVTTLPASEIMEPVLKYAGCTRPARDVVDARIVAEVRARKGHFISSQKDVGGWPTYASAKPPADSDHDGMPDAWEKRHGFNPADGADGPKDKDGDGYTNVEEYLNLTDPTKPDDGRPAPQPAVRIQAGNERIRGAAARKLGEERLARLKKPDATDVGLDAFLKNVRESGKGPGEMLGMRFVKIPPGKVTVLGVRVTLTKPFELAAREVTQAQWVAVMGTRPWAGRVGAKEDPKHPATFVSYISAKEFIRRMNAAGKRRYRLPTQCEWFHAAEAGTGTRYGMGNDRDKVPEYAWCSYKKRKNGELQRHFPLTPQAVGLLKPNPWGLYDMAANAQEWANDRSRWTSWRPAPVDPKGESVGPWRVACGGNFTWRDWQVLRHRRSRHCPYYHGVGVGFRLARDCRNSAASPAM